MCIPACYTPARNMFEAIRPCSEEGENDPICKEYETKSAQDHHINEPFLCMPIPGKNYKGGFTHFFLLNMTTRPQRAVHYIGLSKYLLHHSFSACIPKTRMADYYEGIRRLKHTPKEYCRFFGCDLYYDLVKKGQSDMLYVR